MQKYIHYLLDSTVYYIVRTGFSSQYNLPLTGGVTDPTTQTITLGKTITDNGDGTYTLSDVETVKKVDWYTNYSSYTNYYMCKDLTSTTCDSIYLITSTDNYRITYDNTFNFIYGNDVNWDGTKYTLVDTYTSLNTWPKDSTTIAKKYHYTCLNTTGECSNVYYIHYFRMDDTIWYLTLSSGKNIEDAKNEMFTNTTDSTVKKVVDTWYKDNMIPYTDRLEDTIWCNDRTFYSGSLKGKDTDAGGNYSFSYFSADSRRSSPSVECPNESRDGFTVSISSGGNGALIYPVGLLTMDEVMLAGGNNNSNSKYYLYTGKYYWLLSPILFHTSYAAGSYVYGSGYLIGIYSNYHLGIRPSVSLVPGTRTTGGDGTVYDPYVILTD